MKATEVFLMSKYKTEQTTDTVLMISREQDKKYRKKIMQYFKEHKMPKPVTINYIGRWAHGECYAVTCGLIRLKRYCVYFGDDGGINSVRKR